MKSLFVGLVALITSSLVFAENIELVLGDEKQSFSIDKDSIEKVGQYYQALLIRKIKGSEVFNGIKYDQMNSLIIFNCINNSQFIVRITNFYQGNQVSDAFNPRKEKFGEANDDMSGYICEKYLLLKPN